MEKKRNWIALFSQTGNEIVNLCEMLGVVPDLTITNKNCLELDQVNSLLLENNLRIGNIYLKFTSKKPTVKDYERLFNEFDNPLVTLHGWMRIVPDKICKQFEIYNLHPGLITEYPELKGKDPQEKAWELGLKKSGNVIHRCTAELDGGPIESFDIVHIDDCKSAQEVAFKLHKNAGELWEKFLKHKL